LNLYDIFVEDKVDANEHYLITIFEIFID